MPGKRKIYNAIEKVQRMISPNEVKYEKQLILKIYSKRKKIDKYLKFQYIDYYILGQLLTIIYFFNLNDISLGIINGNYKEIIMVDNSMNSGLITIGIQYTKCNDIANEIIKNSVFHTSLLRSLRNTDKLNVVKFKKGFKDSYDIVINEKMEILKLFESYDDFKNSNWIFSFLNNIRNGSYEDLNRQLKFIDIFFNVSIKEEEYLAMLINEIKGTKLTTEILKIKADKLITEGVFGFYKGEEEITWIIEEDNNIIPSAMSTINSSRIRADFLTLVGENSNEIYYCQIANQALRAVDRATSKNMNNDLED